MSCTADLDAFRRAMAGVKAEMFPGMSIDELCYTHDQASDYFDEVKKRVGAPELTRVFILRSAGGTEEEQAEARQGRTIRLTGQSSTKEGRFSSGGIMEESQ